MLQKLQIKYQIDQQDKLYNLESLKWSFETFYVVVYLRIPKMG